MGEPLFGCKRVAGEETTISAYPRIHIGLLDLSGITSRKYGGAGFSIDGLAIRITARRANRLTISGISGLDSAAQSDLSELLKRLQIHCDDPLQMEICVTDVLPQHIGLGTKTAITMGVCCVVLQFLGYEVDREAVQKLSGRGGTSGVGIHAFFDGGFIVDLGHPTDKAGFAPSSGGRQSTLPLLCKRIPIPENWVFALIVPKGNRLYGQDEISFFTNNTPIPAEEAIKAIALMYHDIVPSVMTGDLVTLSEAITELQMTGFKTREILAQSSDTQELLRNLASAKVGAVGMSSLGPLLFVIADIEDHKAAKCIAKLVEAASAQLLGFFPGNNNGYRVKRHA